MAAGKVAETAVEAVAEVAETVSEESEQFAEITRLLSSRDVGLTISGLGVGVVLGFGGGYLLLRNRLETRYSQIADQEIAGMRAHYDQKLVALEHREEKGLVKGTLEAKVEELDYKPDPRVPTGPIPYDKISQQKEEERPETPEPETKNIFEDREAPEGDGILEGMNPDWDYAAEIASRDPAFPYVIHQDEHREGPEDKEYEKVTLTYYEGDDILADERDQVIDEKDKTVGVVNLSKFGHGSGDPRIVYIRNDQLEADIEVVYSEGKYAQEVHGFTDDEIRHSASMRRRSPRRSEFDDMER